MSNIQYALIGVIVAVGLFLSGMFIEKSRHRCPQVDQSTIDLLTTRVTEKDSAIARIQREWAKDLAIANDIANRQTPTVNEVLPTIPRGRTSAELDSIGAIIFAPW
jgi:hypothetical protein